MKKVVVFGGGTGLSCLLSGLKLFPVDVTTVITVSDNGSSTGVLKKELDIPAVGDVGKVLISMANVDEDFTRLLRYRFSKDGSLHNHPVRNVMLAALIDLKGNLTEATRYMCRLLNVKGTVLPLTEERVELVGETDKGRKAFYGQVAVSRNIRSISRLSYDHDVHVTQEVVSHIRESDLIIFSPGSLYTSILPHLIVPAVVEAIGIAKRHIPMVGIETPMTPELYEAFLRPPGRRRAGQQRAPARGRAGRLPQHRGQERRDAGPRGGRGAGGLDHRGRRRRHRGRPAAPRRAADRVSDLLLSDENLSHENGTDPRGRRDARPVHLRRARRARRKPYPL